MKISVRFKFSLFPQSLVSLLAATSVAFCAFQARADTIAVTFSSTPDDFTPSFDATRGWEFSTAGNINITALGLWDADEDGFSHSHQVGIFSATSVLLIDLVIPSGMTAPLDGFDGFRFVTLSTPFFLAAGTYRIGATFDEDDDDQAAREVGPMGASGISYLGPRFSVSSGFSDPTLISLNDEGIFGPNFKFERALVPDTSSSGVLLLLSMSAMVGLNALRRKTTEADSCNNA